MNINNIINYLKKNLNLPDLDYNDKFTIQQNLVSEFRTSHRWILQDFIYKSIIKKDDSLLTQLILGYTCRILCGIFGMNIYKILTNNLINYYYAIILAFIGSIYIFINKFINNKN